MKNQTFRFRILRFALLLSVGFLCGVAGANAHNVWIEETRNHQLIVRFAEWPDEYEVSPGHLDELSTPDAWKLNAEGKPVVLNVKKKSDQFQLVGASAKESVQIETGYEVMIASNAPSRKPFFYARWQPAGGGAAKPTLNFDIVPTAKPGDYQVYFRGEPLTGAKVTAHLPDGEEQELSADDKGAVHFTASKPGLYMLSCAHQRETVKGFSDGIAYDAVSHNCSLTWRQP